VRWRIQEQAVGGVPTKAAALAAVMVTADAYAVMAVAWEAAVMGQEDR
jgi:hypothetical protein